VQLIAEMVRAGWQSTQAINKVMNHYGSNLSITKTNKAMRKDRNSKKGPIIKFYVAAAAVLSNLKRIEDTCRPTTVASQGDYIVNFNHASHRQNGRKR